MTETVVVHTSHLNSNDAGKALGWQIAEAMSSIPDVVILFASPRYKHKELLQALKQTCHPKLLIGCSSAGEFTSNVHGEGLVCAIALCSDEIRFTATLGRGLRASRQQAAQEVVATFHNYTDRIYPFHCALILSDVLAGYTDDLITHMTRLTNGRCQFFGGGAGDNGQFCNTPVFYDTEVFSDAVVALEICSKKPIGIGSSHGWRPASAPMQVTQVNGQVLQSLDGKPAVEAFQAHAERVRQLFDQANPMPFFLNNLVGIDTGFGYKLRVPIKIIPDGSIFCASDIPADSTICIMGTGSTSAADAASDAAHMALQRLQGSKPAVAIFFDCIATRLRLGKEFGFELETVERILHPTAYAGCNTHGQIIRAEGQFSGFHSCTAVVCLIPT